MEDSMIVADQFIKTLPQGRKEIILKKLNIFEQDLLEAENQIRKLPAGYFVRCIKNTDIYKFRLNNKDRILYTYNKTESRDTSQIVFLRYVTHDNQVRIANQIHADTDSTLEIDMLRQDYEEDTEDETINAYMTQFCENGFIDMDLIPSIVVTEEKLTHLAATNNEEYLYHLSKEQHDILSSLKRRVLLSGAGGTGKTVVLHNVLAYAKESKQSALYVTYNDLLLHSTKNIYEKFVDDKVKNCDFITIRQLELNCYGAPVTRLTNHQELMQWVKGNKDNFKNLREREIYETAVELNVLSSVAMKQLERQIKGENGKSGYYDGELKFEHYISFTGSPNSFNKDEKIDIFNLNKEYIKWLKEENLIDENQVIKKIFKNKIFDKTYDWVIVDEVQDLNENQIYFLNEFTNDSGTIIWAGDVNQNILPTFFSYSSIKSICYKDNQDLVEFSMSKNYRSTKGIVDFINDITEERIRLLGKTGSDYFQESIRIGPKPSILRFNEENLHKLFQSVSDKHYCAIVVPNEDVKEILIKKYDEAASRIFTIYEIKGLEYENIICYNIISAYKELWDEMKCNNVKSKSTMRYHINLIYAASSRAKDTLNIYEDSIDNLEFRPFDSCRELYNYEEQVLGFNKESSSPDWEKEAERLEKAGQNKRAMLIRNLKLEETLLSINKYADEVSYKMYNGISKQIDIKSSFDEAMKPAILLYRQRNYTSALEIFYNLVEVYPDESDLYYYLANCYCYMSMGSSNSYRYFWHSIKLNPNNYKCYLDMAACLTTAGNYDEALEILEAAVKINPQYGNALQLISNVYANKGDMEKALKFDSKSKKLPLFRFDRLNKVWEAPKDKANNGNTVNPIKGTANPKESTIKYPDGLEFIKVEPEGLIKECINGISLKEIKYNKKNKRYILVFDKEMCSICENQEKCISIKADKDDKVSVKEVFIKKLNKLTNEKKIIKSDYITMHTNEDFAKDIIHILNEKYGDDFDNFVDKLGQLTNTLIDEELSILSKYLEGKLDLGGMNLMNDYNKVSERLKDALCSSEWEVEERLGIKKHEISQLQGMDLSEVWTDYPEYDENSQANFMMEKNSNSVKVCTRFDFVIANDKFYFKPYANSNEENDPKFDLDFERKVMDIIIVLTDIEKVTNAVSVNIMSHIPGLIPNIIDKYPIKERMLDIIGSINVEFEILKLHYDIMLGDGNMDVYGARIVHTLIEEYLEIYFNVIREHELYLIHGYDEERDKSVDELERELIRMIYASEFGGED